MGRKQVDPVPIVVGVVLGGAVLSGLGVLLLRRREPAAQEPPARPRPPSPLRPGPAPPLPFDEADIEAMARMLASENPSGSTALHVEQAWTQIRMAQEDRQSLYQRITAGSGWGGQGERAEGGERRPVATGKPATEALRRLAREILEGRRPSVLPGARKFFEPAVQDAVFKIAERGRAKQARGEDLTDREKRLLKYKKSAATIRDNWGKTGRLVGAIQGVEFWT